MIAFSPTQEQAQILDAVDRMMAKHCPPERVRALDQAGECPLDLLARFGEISEARQYSGRLVDDAWRCPFQPPNGRAGDAA